MTEYTDAAAWLNVGTLRDSKRAKGLTAKDIEKMPMEQYTRLRKKAGLPKVQKFYRELVVEPDESAEATASTASTDQQAAGQEGVTLDQLAEMSMAEYAHARGSLISTSENSNGLSGYPGIRNVSIYDRGR